jgi:protein-S-isoprenylcysteine O-methyltransferase Ste14
MNTPEKKDRSPAIAAAVILVVVGVGFFILPKIMLWLGTYSPWLAATFGALFVLAFFLIFWLRARYQRRRGL